MERLSSIQLKAVGANFAKTHLRQGCFGPLLSAFASAIIHAVAQSGGGVVLTVCSLGCFHTIYFNWVSNIQI